jgi:signal transduction histidine kinase
LYLAGRIAGLYGGSLAVASVARQGTTVTLRFPKAEVAAA